MNGVITLLTDFGLRDEYAGVLKGVLAGYAPNCRVIDICHEVPPQNVRGAAHMLEAAWSYFPKGSVHLGVVDPGVGGQREILAAVYEGHCFVAPNNGLLTFLCEKPQTEFFVFDYAKPQYATFHGRDVMAGLAARLALGEAPVSLGRALPAEKVIKISGYRAALLPDRVAGYVVWCDRFGNLITNIRSLDMAKLNPNFYGLSIECAGRYFPFAEFYAAMEPGARLALINSRGCLELALNGGHLGGALNVTLNGNLPAVCVCK